jgi:glutaredoxin
MLTVYSKDSCPQCDQAKNLLATKQIEFEVINVDQDGLARAFIIEEGHRAVPQIYRNGKLFITGGLNGLKKLTDEQLTELIGESNVRA